VRESSANVSVSNEALAQGTSSVGNPALLAAIQKLQTDLQAQLNSLTTTVNSLTTSVTNIQDSIDSVTATTDSNVRAPVLRAPDLADVHHRLCPLLGAISLSRLTQEPFKRRSDHAGLGFSRRRKQ